MNKLARIRNDFFYLFIGAGVGARFLINLSRILSLVFVMVSIFAFVIGFILMIILMIKDGVKWIG